VIVDSVAVVSRLAWSCGKVRLYKGKAPAGIGKLIAERNHFS
jgi:hypothetical protein